MTTKEATIRVGVETTARGGSPLGSARGQLGSAISEGVGGGIDRATLGSSPVARGRLARAWSTAKGVAGDVAMQGVGVASGAAGMMRSGTGALAGIGITLGAVDVARKAMSADEALRKLQFTIKAGSGRMVEYGELQRRAIGISDKWTANTHELTQAQQTLFSETGDYDFAAQSLEKVAVVSRGAREDMGLLSNVAADLNGEFGIQSDEVGDALSKVVSLGHKGGMSIEEMGGNLKKLGASAKLAGIQGSEGFGRMIGFLAMAEDETGSLKQAMTLVTDVASGLETGELQKKARKAGINANLKGLPMEDAMAKLISASGGDMTKLGKVFTDAQMPAIKKLVDAFNEGKATGGIEGGAEKVKEAFDKASSGVLSYADMEKEAAKRNQEAGSKFEAAMNKLTNALTSDAAASALSAFAGALDKAAKGLASLPDKIPGGVKPIMPGTDEDVTDLLGIGGAGIAMRAHPILGAAAAVGAAIDQIDSLNEETGAPTVYSEKLSEEQMKKDGLTYVGQSGSKSFLYKRYGEGSTITAGMDAQRLEEDRERYIGNQKYLEDFDTGAFDAMLAERRKNMDPALRLRKLRSGEMTPDEGEGFATSRTNYDARGNEYDPGLYTEEEMGAPLGYATSRQNLTPGRDPNAGKNSQSELASIMNQMLGAVKGPLRITGDVNVVTLPDRGVGNPND